MVDGIGSTAGGTEIAVTGPSGGAPCRLVVAGDSVVFADAPSRDAGPRLLAELLNPPARNEIVRMVATAVLGDGGPTADDLRRLVERCEDVAVRKLAGNHPELPADVLRVLLVDPDTQVRLAAQMHPDADALADDLLPSSGRGPATAEELATDPWPHGWTSPTVSAVNSAGVTDLHAGAFYRDHPFAQMFDWSFPVPLDVEVGGPEFLPDEEQHRLDDVRPGSDEVWVVRSVHDPRAWFAAGLVRMTEDEWEGRWITTRTVLGPWLSDVRCHEAIVRWLSVEDAYLPVAVSATLAAWTVLSPGPRHDGRAALGSVMVPGWWRRGWLSPLSTERASALQFTPDDPMAPMIYELLSHDRNREVRRTVAQQAASDPAVMARLATDHDPEVRTTFTKFHEHEIDALPESALVELASDDSDEIRRTLADSAALPEAVRRMLAEDPEPETAARAEARSPEGPRCGWRCVGHKGLSSWDCGRAAEIEAALDDGTRIGLCRRHRDQLNPWGPKVRCTACGINPAIWLDLTGTTGPSPSPVCADCGDWINDYNNGGVTFGEDAWAQFRPKRPPGF